MSPSTLNRVFAKDLALKSLDQLPPFSPVLNHLMASLADADVPFSQLAAVIERDTVLSANVLRLVNSALYGRQGQINSVRAAVSILGINKLRNYLLGMSVSRMFAKVRTAPTWQMERFNDHSVAVAVLCDLIVQKANIDYPEGAFIAGLLHDLGRLMIAIALPDEFERIQTMHQESGRPLEVCELELLDVTHSELTASALSRWKLPNPIQKAVLYHHHSALDPTATPGGPPPLSVALHVANDLANALGHGIACTEPSASVDLDNVLARVGLSGQSEALRAAFQTELATVQASF